MSRRTQHPTRRGVTIAALAALLLTPALASAGPNARTSVDVHVSVNNKHSDRKPNHNGCHDIHAHPKHAKPSRGYFSAEERLLRFERQDRCDKRWERYNECEPVLYDHAGAPYPPPVYASPAYPAPVYGAPAYASPAYGAPACGAPVACETPVPYAAPVYAAPVYAAPVRYPQQRINVNVSVNSRRDRYLAPRRYRAW